MSSKTSMSGKSEEGVVLAPNPRLPLIIIIFGLSLKLLPLNSWPTILVSSFGLFLLLQSFTLRLKFTTKDLVVLQLGKELRRFPFSKWISWRIFLPGLPGLLYFREEASPHLLPILFNREDLVSELQKKVANLEIQKTDPPKQTKA
tara:strand:- start:32 stop:469 length:438 start_codon:yes stop_codon:yes gene_type:complete